MAGFVRIGHELYVSGRSGAADFEAVQRFGVRSSITNRPNGEEQRRLLSCAAAEASGGVGRAP